MEALQHLITPLKTTWSQVESAELVTFSAFFAAMWLIAMLIETAVKKVMQEN